MGLVSNMKIPVLYMLLCVHDVVYISLDSPSNGFFLKITALLVVHYDFSAKHAINFFLNNIY